MNEIDFRLQCLKKSIGKFDKKRIALYGIAANAKAILRNFPEQNIIALLDEKNIGKYIYGKKIISLEEATLLNIEVIIIAAEVASSWIVSKRISEFCRTHSILLLNMYGMNEEDINTKILLQEISYASFCKEDIHKKIAENEIICFQLMDVLCANKYEKKENFFKEVGRVCNEYAFAKNRMLAETMCDPRRPYGIKEIYDNYWTLTLSSEEEIRFLQKQEQEVFVQGFIPKDEIISILNDSFLKGKKIYIISEFYYSEDTIKKLLKELGVREYSGIVQPNLVNLRLSNGALRRVLDKWPDEKALYIGTNDKYNLLLPQIYQMEFCMVKSSWKILEELSGLDIGEENITEEKRSILWQWAQKTITSPFIQNNSFHMGQIQIERANMAGTVRLPELFPLPKYKNIAELEVLNFPVYNMPVVSVIIPVYNQFAYTYNCLKSIFYNAGKVEYEVIVADDASTDDTIYLDKVVTGIRIIQNEKNLLFLKNCNQAAKYAKGKYIVFLNNDTQVQYNWLKTLVEILEQSSDVGMAGSKLLYPNGVLQEAGGIIWKDGTGANYGRGSDPDMPEYNYVKEVDYVTGASIIIRKELWDVIGGFDERFVPAYCEDSDLAFEVRKHGKKVMYQPASVVVHFEGISNGKEVTEGVKSYQVINNKKLKMKWNSILNKEHYQDRKAIFRARERKAGRKTILVLTETIPTYDCDAGSKTVFNYLKLFVKKGYIVKIIAKNFLKSSRYIYELQHMGIEVLYGDYYKKNFDMWLLQNQDSIEYAFLNYPGCGEKYIDVLKCTSIKIIYYGHDLHFLRNYRQYKLNGDTISLQKAKEFYKVERDVIEKADVVYYPSEEEVQLVKKQFGKENVRQIAPYIYFTNGKRKNIYKLEKRNGILFIGGYGHLPNVDAVLWFAKEIYPQVYERKPIPFYLVGSKEPAEIQELNHPGIIHKGYLTEQELGELYGEIRVSIVPLRYGAGVKGKVIDAMYHGVPIISTSIGIEGIKEAEGCIEIADTAKEFAMKLLSLYDNNSRLSEMSRKYGLIIRNQYSPDAAWDKIKDDFL